VMQYKSKGTLIENAMTPYNLMDDLWVCVGGTTQHMNNFITHWMPLPDTPDNIQQQIQSTNDKQIGCRWGKTERCEYCPLSCPDCTMALQISTKKENTDE